MAGLLGLFGSGARNSPASYLPAPQDPNNPIPRALLIGAMLQDVGNNLRGSGATDNQMQARMLGYQLQQRAMLMKAQQAIARAAAGLPMQEDSDGSPAPQAAPQPPPQPAPQAPDPSLTAPDPNADASVPPPDPGPALTSQVGQDLGGTGGLTPDAQLAKYQIAAPQAPAIPPPPVVAPPPQAPTQQSLVQSRGPRRPVTMRDMAPAIANMALIPGSEDLVKNDIALFSAADPKVTYDRRGYGNDQYGNPVGGFHPEISADRAPLYDQAGHIVGEQNLIGAPEATAATAQAKAEAEARTAAKYDLIPVPILGPNGQPNGKTKLMPRINALAGSVGGAPGAPPGPAAGAAANGAQFGVAQSPSDATYNNATATDAAGRYKGLQDAAAAAPGYIARLQGMGTLLKGVEGGHFAPDLYDLASAANSLGFKIDPKLPNKDAAMALQSQMAAEAMKNPDTGTNMFPRVTNFEYSNALKQVPGLLQSAAGRDTIIAMKTAEQNRITDTAAKAFQWNQRYGRIDAPDETGHNFQYYLNKWAASHPLYKGIRGLRQ